MRISPFPFIHVGWWGTGAKQPYIGFFVFLLDKRSICQCRSTWGNCPPGKYSVKYIGDFTTGNRTANLFLEIWVSPPPSSSLGSFWIGSLEASKGLVIHQRMSVCVGAPKSGIGFLTVIFVFDTVRVGLSRDSCCLHTPGTIMYDTLTCKLTI